MERTTGGEITVTVRKIKYKMEITEILEKRHKGVRQSPIRQQKDKIPVNRIMPRKKSGIKEPHGSGGGGSEKLRTSFHHELKSIKKYFSKSSYKRCGNYGFKYIGFKFKKKQLIGGIIQIGKRKYRVVA